MRNKAVIILLAVFFGGLLLQRPVRGREVSEYSVEAAYLFNFAKFVQWPAKTFANEKSPFVIGVLGDDPFEELLDRAVEGKSVNGHILKVRRFESYDLDQLPELRHCQILFIAYSEKSRLRAILKGLKGAEVLTVSEIEKFPLAGGMVLFDQVGKKISLVVNPAAARQSQLKISARLLQVSKIYKAE